MGAKAAENGPKPPPPPPLVTPLKALFRLKTKQQELLIRVIALALIYVLAFAVRLFSVLRYESMIHEFDPYFNYRTTLFLTRNGFYEFWNWFDSESWYPLGRIIGGTLYPGLMVTAALIYRVLRFLTFAVHIRDVCVLTAPFFASNTTIVAYFFGKEIWDSGAGLVAAALIAICPGYISSQHRIARLGSCFCVGYFYMVSAWGGYVFIINLIPLYVLVLLVTGRYSMRLYVAYNCMYILGMLLAMQIRFVGFQHVQSGEHMAAMGVFFLLQVVDPKRTYGQAADIWSLGCTVLEMLTRRIPYPHLEPTQALFRIGHDEPPPIPDSLSQDAYDFISKCVQVNPDDRPTASELLEHPFVKRPLKL